MIEKIKKERKIERLEDWKIGRLEGFKRFNSSIILE